MNTYKLLLLLLLAPLTVYADMSPARIGTHDTSLAKRISFPEGITGDVSLYLRCEAKVLPGGSIDEAGCYGDEDIDPLFYRAVNIGSNSATMTPATVEGINVPVLALFTVMFRQQGDQRAVAVVPNHGSNAKDLGLNYVAPQRYGRRNQYTPRTDLGLLWVDTTMSAEGEPSKIKYIETQWTNRETKRFAKSYIQNNTFIPGFFNGEPRAMRFIKPIFGYKNGFMIQPESNRCRDTLVVCDETSGTTGRPRYVFDD